jgi:hypothetical protein
MTEDFGVVPTQGAWAFMSKKTAPVNRTPRSTSDKTSIESSSIKVAYEKTRFAEIWIRDQKIRTTQCILQNAFPPASHKAACPGRATTGS